VSVYELFERPSYSYVINDVFVIVADICSSVVWFTVCCWDVHCFCTQYPFILHITVIPESRYLALKIC